MEWIDRSFLAFFLLIPFLTYSCIFSPQAQQRHKLISDHLPATEQLKPPDDFPPSARWRAVKLDPAVTSRDKIKKGDEIVLNLFPNAEYIAHIDKIDQNDKGTVTIRGKLENYENGQVLITRYIEDTFVNIFIPEEKKLYRILGNAKQNFKYLLEINSEAYLLDPDDPRLDLPTKTPFIKDPSSMPKPTEKPDTPARKHQIKNDSQSLKKED